MFEKYNPSIPISNAEMAVEIPYLKAITHGSGMDF
jgi:hypothetical protein